MVARPAATNPPPTAAARARPILRRGTCEIHSWYDHFHRGWQFHCAIVWRIKKVSRRDAGERQERRIKPRRHKEQEGKHEVAVQVLSALCVFVVLFENSQRL